MFVENILNSKEL